MHRRDIFELTAIAPALVAGASAQTAAAGSKPETLDAYRNDTVIALTDLIIPVCNSAIGFREWDKGARVPRSFGYKA